MSTKPQPKKLMTRAEFARHRQVDKSTVTIWGRKEYLVFKKNQKGKSLIDREATEAVLLKSIDSTRGRPTNTTAARKRKIDQAARPMSFEDARLAKTIEEITRLQLANAKESGSLVDAGDYIAAANKLARSMRDGMHALARQIMDRLASETDARKVYAILTAEVDRVLTDLAEGIDQGDLADGDDDETTLESELAEAPAD